MDRPSYIPKESILAVVILALAFAAICVIACGEAVAFAYILIPHDTAEPDLPFFFASLSVLVGFNFGLAAIIDARGKMCLVGRSSPRELECLSSGGSADGKEQIACREGR